MATAYATGTPERFEAVKTAEASRQSQQTSNDDVEAALNKLFRDLDRSTWRNRQARYYRRFENEMFWRGVQLFTYDPSEGMPLIWDEEDQDLYNTINITKWAVEMNAAEYTKSRPKLTAHSNKGDDRKVRQALPEIDYLADCLYFDLWLSDPELEQREAHEVQFGGGVIGLIDFDPKGGPKVQSPRYKPQMQMMPGSLACPDCGVYEPIEGEAPGQQAGNSHSETPQRTSESESANPDAALGGLPVGTPQMQQQGPAPSTCPYCGSPNAQISPPTPIETLSVEGYDEIPQGQITYRDYDLLQVGVSERPRTTKEASWVRLDEVVERTKIKEMFPWVQVEDYTPTPAAFGQFSGLHFLRQLETAIGNSGELDQSDGYELGRGVQITDEQTCLYSRVFLDHHKYSEIPVKDGGLQLPGTTDVIPAGMKLGQPFPKGMLCHLVNEKIVKMENLDKNTRLTGYKYAAGGSGFFSAGCDDIISINKAYNEENSVGLAWLLSAAYGITLVDEKIKGITNAPDAVMVVDDRRADESLQDMYHHVQNTGPTAEVEAMKESHKRDAQLVSGARNPNVNGMPGEGMRTATGVNYQSATSDSFAAMRLLLKAWQRAHAMTQAVNLWRERALRPQWFTKYGETRGRFIDPLVLPDDVGFRVEEDSHQPRTNDDIRADTMAAIHLGWASGKLSPAADEHVGKTFRMPLSADSYALWETKIERRLDVMKQIVEMLTQEGLDQDPAALMLVMQPMLPRPLDNPLMLLRFVDELYLSDEYENFPPVMQLAFDQLYPMYKMAAVERMAKQTAMAVAAAPPEDAGNSKPNKGKGASAS